MFSRCIASTTWQIYRIPKSHRLSVISSYTVSSFSRTCWVLSFFCRNQDQSLTHRCCCQNRYHRHTFNIPVSLDLGGIQDILTFLILFQFETMSSYFLFYINFTCNMSYHGAVRATPFCRALILMCWARVSCSQQINYLLLCLYICIMYSKVCWQDCFWFHQK